MPWSSNTVPPPTSIKRSKETSLWGWLKASADRMGKRAHVQRIEDDTKSGTPDVEGCIESKAFWCELKVAYPMAKDRVRIKITTDQVRWARKRVRASGKAFILIRVDGLTRADVRHFLIPGGNDAEELLEPISIDRLTELSLCHPKDKAPIVLGLMAV